MQIAGVRELKNRLTYYLRFVRKGETVMVTDRGTPVAVLRPLQEGEGTVGREERLAMLASQGYIHLPLHRERERTKPVPLRGTPLSRIVIEDRR